MINLSKTTMVLAAGFGKRLGEITKDIPKPLLPIGNTCCLEISINTLREAGFKRIIINTHYHADQIKNYVKRFNNLEILISYEPELLETAGGIRKVLAEFGNSPFIVLNADMYWHDTTPSIIKKMAENMQELDDFCLAVTPLNNAQGYPGLGDFVLENSLLQKPRDDVSNRYVYIGVQLINPKVIAHLPIAPLSLSGLYKKACEKNSLRGVIFNNKWVDIGSISGLILARKTANFSIV